MAHPNLFVYGLSSSGKDTTTNHLCETKNYRKVRLAKTIKQVICETQNLTPDELEEQKRNNPELRKMHASVSDVMDKNCSGEFTHNLVRLNQLVNKTSIDFEMLDKEEIKKPLFFTDVREFTEAINLLEAGAKGIFLMRTSTAESDIKNKGHRTEKNMFTRIKGNPSDMDILVSRFPDSVIIIDNCDVIARGIEITTENYVTFEEAQITKEVLTKKLDEVFSNLPRY